MNKRLTARNMLFFVFILAQYCFMVSEVKELNTGENWKHFECHLHAFMMKYWSVPETKMDGMLKHTCLVQLVKLSQITMT